MRPRSIARSPGQSSPNLNLYILPLLPLFPPRSTLVTRMRHSDANESLRNSRKTHRIEFHCGRLKIRVRRILFLIFWFFFFFKEDERIRGFLKIFLEKKNKFEHDGNMLLSREEKDSTVLLFPTQNRRSRNRNLTVEESHREIFPRIGD